LNQKHTQIKCISLGRVLSFIRVIFDGLSACDNSRTAAVIFNITARSRWRHLGPFEAFAGS
jgi:hypothetical protein